MLALVFLGTLAGMTEIADCHIVEIQRESLGIADCRIGFRVDREVWHGAELESCDTRYTENVVKLVGFQSLLVAPARHNLFAKTSLHSEREQQAIGRRNVFWPLTVYFVTSLDPEAVLPFDLQSLARGHWQVGGVFCVGCRPPVIRLHPIKDRTLNEDRHSVRRDGLGPRILKIRGAGTSVLHLLRNVGESVREIAETIHFRPKDVLQILGFSQYEQ